MLHLMLLMECRSDSGEKLKKRHDYDSPTFDCFPHLILDLRDASLQKNKKNGTNTTWGKTKERTRVDDGAEIQLFVLHGCPCCVS